jgi:hypothetical protein
VLERAVTFLRTEAERLHEEVVLRLGRSEGETVLRRAFAVGTNPVRPQARRSERISRRLGSGSTRVRARATNAASQFHWNG